MKKMTRQEKKRAEEKRKRDEKNKGHICKYEVMELPTPLQATTLENVKV